LEFVTDLSVVLGFLFPDSRRQKSRTRNRKVWKCGKMKH